MTGFQSKVPPVRVVVDEQYFNLIIQILTNVEKILNTEKEIEQVKKLKDKILKYSIIRQDEDMTLIDMRFFINEASLLIEKMMFLFENKIEIEADYFELLKQIKETKNTTD